MSIRVLVADDHKLIRRGLCDLIETEPDLFVVCEAADSDEAIRLAHELRPDVVLMDISMPGTGGIEATRRLQQVSPTVRVLILTVHEDTTLVDGAIRAGAAGYILTRAADSELTDAVRAVARGDMYLHPALTRGMLRGLAPIPASTGASDDPLTPRAKEVLRLLARGHTNRQIADKLNISIRTAEGHRANLMAKLGLASRVELVNYAEQHNLLD